MTDNNQDQSDKIANLKAEIRELQQTIAELESRPAVIQYVDRVVEPSDYKQLKRQEGRKKWQ